MNNKASVVKETNFGVYLWEMPDGRYLADEDYNFLSIDAREGDWHKIKAITDAAIYWIGEGIGKPVFCAGPRKVTDDEYEHQLMRQRAGLVPDPLDYRAAEEAAKYARKHGRK